MLQLHSSVKPREAGKLEAGKLGTRRAAACRYTADLVSTGPPRGVSGDPERAMVFKVMKMNLGLLTEDEPLRS